MPATAPAQFTKLPLPEPHSLIPNHALRNLITNYTLLSFPKPHHLHPPCPQSLIQLLISPSSQLEDRLNSLKQLNWVCKRDSATRRRLAKSATALFTLCSFSDNRVRAVQCGVVPILIQNADSGLERVRPRVVAPPPGGLPPGPRMQMPPPPQFKPGMHTKLDEFQNHLTPQSPDIFTPGPIEPENV